MTWKESNASVGFVSEESVSGVLDQVDIRTAGGIKP